MDINNNEFFSDIKRDELDNENISASGIHYGEAGNTSSSSSKTILIAVGIGAIVAGTFVFALGTNKKSSPTNLAEIPTISSSSDSIKTEPQEQKLNEVYENASVYAPVNFDDEAKKLINANVVKPAPIPAAPVVVQRVEPVKKIEVKKPIVLKTATHNKPVVVVKTPSQQKVSVAPTTTAVQQKTAQIKATTPVVPKDKVATSAHAAVATLKPVQELVEHKTNVKNEVEISKVARPLPPSTPKASIGKWNVQLASTSSETAAQKEWLSLSTKHPDILRGLNHSVIRTEISGKTYYRLRIVGLETSAIATDICNQLKSQNLSCFVTK